MTSAAARLANWQQNWQPADVGIVARDHLSSADCLVNFQLNHDAGMCDVTRESFP